MALAEGAAEERLEVELIELSLSVVDKLFYDHSQFIIELIDCFI